MLNNIDKERKSDRVLVLEPIEGQKVRGSTGMVDPTLFTGENNIHALQEPITGFWRVKYDRGSPPPSIKEQKFTSFNRLMEFLGPYFEKRGVSITKVID